MGPLLWDIAYDSVLDTQLLADCEIFCYADDTFVVAKGNNSVRALVRVEIATAVTLLSRDWSCEFLRSQKLSCFMRLNGMLVVRRIIFF